MKKVFRSFLMMSAALGLLFFTGCKGKDGDPGPKGDTGNTGSQGPKGEQGLQGNTGPKGDKGEQGNANVKSYDLTLNRNLFIENTTTKEWSTTFNVTLLDFSQSLSDKDVLLMYIKTGEETSGGTTRKYYAAMPYLDYFSASSFNQHSFEPSFTSGIVNPVKVKIRNSNGIAPYDNMSIGSLIYKVILIKGGISARMSETVDLSNYEAVAEYYGLEK